MQTTKTEPKRKRRRGSQAEELAKLCNTTVYKAKQYIKCVDKVHTLAPELGNFIKSGALKVRDALPLLDVLELAPELIPLVVSGGLPLHECIEAMKQGFKQVDDGVSFEEKVEKSFERFLSKWPKDKRQEIWSVIEDTFEAFYEE